MRIGVLGPLSVDGDGAAFGRRDRVVLEALTVRLGAVVSAEQLADALWGEELPASWGKVVQGCVVRTRKRLGTKAVETTPHGYRLTVSSDDVDAQRFEGRIRRGRELMALGEPERATHAIGEALALWRGRPLVDLEEWDAGRIEAGRLDELHQDAEELALEAALRAGRHVEVLAEAQARVAERPLREPRWALLARAEYQAGRQADALRTLRRARAFLIAETGLDPGTDLVELEDAILRQDPALAPDPSVEEPSPACPYLGLVHFDIDDSEAFFGRERALVECLHTLDEAGALAVVGPSGSGKSSLVRAGVAAALERDGRPVVVITPGKRPTDALTVLPKSGPAPVLVVDQCEEAVTLCDDPTERTRFFAAVADYAERAPVVIALRADRLGDVSGHRRFARLTEQGLHLLGAMNEAELRLRSRVPPTRPASSSNPDSSTSSFARSKGNRGRFLCCRMPCVVPGSGGRVAP